MLCALCKAFPAVSGQKLSCLHSQPCYLVSFPPSSLLVYQPNIVIGALTILTVVSISFLLLVVFGYHLAKLVLTVPDPTAAGVSNHAPVPVLEGYSPASSCCTCQPRYTWRPLCGMPSAPSVLFLMLRKACSPPTMTEMRVPPGSRKRCTNNLGCSQSHSV